MMKEGKPKDENVVDFTERQRRRMNEGRRKEIEIVPDGNLLYPEEQAEITTRHALELAEKIIQDHGPDSEGDRIRRGETNFSLDRKQMASQAENATQYSTESIVKILALHEKYPSHYSRELILSVAEELTHRLSPP